MSQSAETPPLSTTKKSFVETWGEMGPTWGINRTMAQIHALLMVSEQPLSTDEVMAHLRISRGNANINLRELVSWGLVRRVVRLGERREFFEGEKQTWKIFCNIARERKRRELDPLAEALQKMSSQAEAEGESAVFKKQLQELGGIVHQAGGALDRIAQLRNSGIAAYVMKALEKLPRKTPAPTAD